MKIQGVRKIFKTQKYFYGNHSRKLAGISKQFNGYILHGVNIDFTKLLHM